MQKYGFVYVWRDRKHNRYYVGSHWGIENDGYVCSSRWMHNSYKRRPQDFKRKVVERIFTNRVDTYKAEQRWLDMIKKEEVKIRYYNFDLVTKEHWSHDPEKLRSISERASESTKRVWANPAQREQRIEIFLTKRKSRTKKGDRQHSEAMKKRWQNPVHQQLVSSRLSKAMTGMLWWVNNEGRKTRSRECPGPEWSRVRK